MTTSGQLQNIEEAGGTFGITDSRFYFYFRPRIVKDTLAKFAVDNGINKVERFSGALHLLNKHACTNGGHCIMENMFPAAMNMLYWELAHCGNEDGTCNVFDNHIVLLENSHDSGSDCGCFDNPHGCGSEGTSPHFLALCTKFVNMYLGALSARTPTYQNLLTSADRSAKTLQCWDRAYAGAGPIGPYTDPAGDRLTMGAGLGYELLRDMAYARWGVPRPSFPERRAALRTDRRVRVLVNVKIGRRMISNIDKVAQWAREHEMRNALGGGASIHFDVTVVRWEDVGDGLRGQLNLLSTTDIYVSSCGSGSINAVFLPDASALIVSQFCDWHDGRSPPPPCDSFEGLALHEHMPHYGLFTYQVDQADEMRYIEGSSSPRMHDIIFKKEKFTALLEQAANHVLAGIRWRG